MTEDVVFEPSTNGRDFAVVKQGVTRGMVAKGFNGKWYFVASAPFSTSPETLTSIARFIRTLPVTEKSTGTTN